jgi:hypothetical protein
MAVMTASVTAIIAAWVWFKFFTKPGKEKVLA